MRSSGASNRTARKSTAKSPAKSLRKRKRVETSDSDDSTIPASLPLDGNDDTAGIIEKICLKNFMCHANLEFNFGPHLNFIIGRNGSGKSAVLSAIILGLGGKSSVTGRNPNTRDFIQTGKHHSDISITLKNTGVDAYRYSDFGPKIIIERRFHSDGGSNYKMKSISGRLISSKKEELDNITGALNIQVDNPVAVLTQDASRSFLGSNDSKKKYSFFIKATQLEKWAEYIEQAEKTTRNTISSLKMKKQTLPASKKEVQKWEDLQKSLVALDDEEVRKRNLENELAWASVRDAKQQVSLFTEAKEKCQKVVDKIEADIENCEKQISQQKERKKKSVQHIQQCKNGCLVLKGEMNAIKQRVSDFNQDHKNLKHRLRHYQSELQAKNLEVDNLKRSIDLAKQKFQENYAEGQKNYEKEIGECKTAIEALEEEKKQTAAQLPQNQQAIDHVIKEQADLVQEEKSYQYKINKKTGEYQDMESSRKEKAALYGQWMPELLEKIKHCQRFRKKPIGPLGMYVKVKDPRWSFAVETCLGYYLHNFCCDSQYDRNILVDIIKNTRGSHFHGTVVSKFEPQVYNVQHNKVQSNKYMSVLDAISCDRPEVLNCLIDQVHIERILLIEDNTEAVNLMMENPPKNCSSAYTKIGDQLFPEPKFRYYSCSKRREVRYLKECITQEDINNKLNEISALQNKVHEINQQKNNLNMQVEELKKKNQMIEGRLRGIQSQINMNNLRVEKIKELESSYMQLPTQEQELKNLMQIQEKYSVEVDYYTRKVKNKFSELNKEEQRFTTKQIALAMKEEELGRLKSEMEKHDENISVWEDRKKQFMVKLISEKKNLETKIDELNESKQSAEVLVTAASALCEEINTEKEVSFIKSEIAELEKNWNERSRELDREEINKNYIQYKKNYEKILLEISRLKELIKKMEKIIVERREKFINLRRDSTLKVNYLFTQNLHARGFQALPTVDHETRSFEIKINPRVSGDLHKTAMLSGGERSFVTVSLLLALYFVTELPFHILDEYDVCMDETNREVSMQVMLDMVRSQTRSQFIFLSPLELPSVVKGGVKIHKMPDPKRSIGNNRQCDDSSNSDG